MERENDDPDEPKNNETEEGESIHKQRKQKERIRGIPLETKGTQEQEKEEEEGNTRRVLLDTDDSVQRLRQSHSSSSIYVQQTEIKIYDPG